MIETLPIPTVLHAHVPRLPGSISIFLDVEDFRELDLGSDYDRNTK